MTLAQCFLFWRLAIGNSSGIPPNAIFNDEFERGLFKENQFGEWVLNKRHHEYRAYWCEAFDNFARILYTQGPSNHLFYLGHTSDFQEWSADTIDILAVVAHADPGTAMRLNDVTTRLNQCLNGVPASWKKTGFVPRLNMHIQNAHEPWVFPKASPPKSSEPISLLHPEEMRVLVGNTAWFVHRNQLTGLLVEPRLARCYANKWSAAAVDILVRGSHEHRMEFRRCWTEGIFSGALLNKVKAGMTGFLQANDSINPTGQAWSAGLERFMRDESLAEEVFVFEGDEFSRLIQPSIP